MVNAEEWKENLVTDNKYHIIARLIEEDAIFIKMGVVGIPEWPVFSIHGVNRMIPWRGIDQIEPVG